MHTRPIDSRATLALTALCTAFLAACGGSGTSSGAPETTYIKIGTASQTGVYYPVGAGIAQWVNKAQSDHGVQASVEATDGSVFNINALMTGDLDFGIVQADRQYQAVHGEAEWAAHGAQSNLRAVCSLYTEMVTLAAAEDAGIEQVGDLKGKRVNIGNPGSGTRVNAIDVLTAAGLDPETDIDTQDITAGESPKLFQDNRLDAFFFTVGHPAGTFMELTAGTRPARFVSIAGPAVTSLIASKPYYSTANIPVADYPGILNTSDAATIGLKTTLVTSATVSDDVVYAVTKAIFDNLDAFRGTHAALNYLKAEEMVQGNFAPLHPGAARYFQEAGLLPATGA